MVDVNKSWIERYRKHDELTKQRMALIIEDSQIHVDCRKLEILLIVFQKILYNFHLCK